MLEPDTNMGFLLIYQFSLIFGIYIDSIKSTRQLDNYSASTLTIKQNQAIGDHSLADVLNHDYDDEHDIIRFKRNLTTITTNYNEQEQQLKEPNIEGK